MNKQQLASKIWAAANKMRSKIEANEYKDFILGFMFYKFLSDKEIKFLKENDFTEEDIATVSEEDQEVVDFIQNGLGYFISYNDLFTTWISKGSDFTVADVNDALSAFDRLINVAQRRVFKGIFDTLRSGLTKLGDSDASRTKSVRDLLYLIKEIPMDGKQDYDVLGFIYEYLISNFAANAGKKAGEFYTPHEVSLLMSEIVAEHLKDRNEIKIYDPTSGSGSLLINIGKCISKYIDDENNIQYYAQELKEATYNLTRMNLVMRGILADNIITRNGDTLETDWPFFDDADPENTYDPLYVDAVVSNPPYSQNWEPKDKESDPRFARFGVAPKGKADYAFLLHDLYHLKPEGIMTIVLPHGVLFRGNEEGTIRKNLIENNHIDAIIGLPANIFFGTGIPTIIMVLKQKRTNTDVLIIDASKGYTKEGKNNKLRASDIKKIVDTVTNRVSIDKYSRVVSRDEIRANDYNLNIPRYVDSSEKAESWDIYASMFGGIPQAELADYDAYWNTFAGLKQDVFDNADSEYVSAKDKDVKTIIFNNVSVKSYLEKFNNSIAGLDKELSDFLIDGMLSVNISKAETILDEYICKRVSNIELLDRYSAYEILDQQWKDIAGDLEIIQTEGKDAIRVVDPNMIIKKKDGKETEVQDGWKGRIISFALVQDILLSDELACLRLKENRIDEITGNYESLLEKLSEEEKEKSFVNEDASGFVFAEVKKSLKAKSEDEGVLDILKQVDSLSVEEKMLKKELKSEEVALIDKTKKTIENLSDDQIYNLLYCKWINPIIDALCKQPVEMLEGIVKNISALVTKYEVTMHDVDEQIRDAESALSGMLDQLSGNEYDVLGLNELKKLFGGN